MAFTDLSPREIAIDMIAKHNGIHRNAECQAWDLRKHNGADSERGKMFARVALEIADQKLRDESPEWMEEMEKGNYDGHVPVFGARHA